MNTNPDFLILGGGPAGLSCAHYARLEGLSSVVLEASSSPGGNCRTLELNGCHYDTGAHRIHDRDAEITADIRALVGEDLLEVSAPSQIFWSGPNLHFPPRASELARVLSPLELLQAGFELARALPAKLRPPRDFAEFACQRYGRTIAAKLLLPYSQKLWGAPTQELSPRIAGERLRGIDVWALLRAQFLGERADTSKHLDGHFLYPPRGIGQIFDAMAQKLPPGCLQLEQAVTQIELNGNPDEPRIAAILTDDGTRVEVSPHTQVVSTLPLSVLVRALGKQVSPRLHSLVSDLRFRHVRLCALQVDRPQITPNASLYFPDPEDPFVRLYEPKNRSAALAPPQQTCVGLEVPCSEGDDIFSTSEDALASTIIGRLEAHGLVHSPEILDLRVTLLRHAYPVLTAGFETLVQRAESALGQLHGLHLIGRNSRYRYQHIHDVLRSARDFVTKSSTIPVSSNPQRIEGSA